MPDVDDDLDVDDAFPEAGEDDRFKEMRRAANRAAKLGKENAALTARLAEMERQVALTQAGLVSLNDKQTKALLAAHEGEFTKDALRTTAADLGFITLTDDTPDPAVEQALQTQARITAAAQGTQPPRPAVKLDDQIAQAAQAGDMKLVGKLKAQAALNMLRAGQPVRVTE